MVAGLLAVFIAGLTANVVARDGLTTIDPDIADWAVAHRNDVLTPIAITVSNIGGTVAMTTLATLAVLTFGWFGYWRAAGLVIVTGLLSWLFVDGGKHLIARPRPPVDLHVVVKTTFAYPSGHSLGSMAIVGIVSVLLIPRLRRRAARWIGGGGGPRGGVGGGGRPPLSLSRWAFPASTSVCTGPPTCSADGPSARCW